MPDIFVDIDQKPKKNIAGTRAESVPKPHHATQFNLRALETFCEHPGGITLKNLSQGEELLLFLRRHHITNLPWVIITILLVLLPILTVPFLEIVFPIFQTLPVEYIIIGIGFFYLIVFGYALINFLQWFYNIGIIATKHVVDIDYTQIVQVHVAATKLVNVEDVSFLQTGFIQTLFNYGDVHVQTAGSNPNIEFLKVPDPGRATLIIQKLIGHV